MPDLPETMKAAVYHGQRDIRIAEVPVPSPGHGDLLLEVHAAGVCGTDAGEYAHGPTMFPITERHPESGHVGPMIPGHEFGGRVVEVGEDVEGLLVGDLVTTGAGISCGVCDPCLDGHTNMCVRYFTAGLQRHGGLAQYASVPADICLEVGSLGLTDDGAGIVQPMSIAVHSMHKGDPRPTDDVLVIGAGGVGAFIVYAVASTGATVTASDLDTDRLEIARALGASHTVRAERDTPLSHILGDIRPRIVYEVSGSRAALGAAIGVVAPGGTVVAVGLHEHPVDLDVRTLTLRELRLVGTNAHSFAADAPEAARLVADRDGGWGDVAPVAIPLDDLVAEALEPLAAGVSTRIKTLIDPWAETARATTF